MTVQPVTRDGEGGKVHPSVALGPEPLLPRPGRQTPISPGGGHALVVAVHLGLSSRRGRAPRSNVGNSALAGRDDGGCSFPAQ